MVALIRVALSIKRRSSNNSDNIALVESCGRCIELSESSGSSGCAVTGVGVGGGLSSESWRSTGVAKAAEKAVDELLSGGVNWGRNIYNY
jgi:hypothetical protein